MEHGCGCDGCEVLWADVQDKALFRLYCEKLLIRGWAGHRSTAERRYVRSHAEWSREASRVSRERDLLKGFNRREQVGVEGKPTRLGTGRVSRGNHGSGGESAEERGRLPAAARDGMPERAAAQSEGTTGAANR